MRGKSITGRGRTSIRTLKWDKDCFLETEKRPVGQGWCDTKKSERYTDSNHTMFSKPQQGFGFCSQCEEIFGGPWSGKWLDVKFF